MFVIERYRYPLIAILRGLTVAEAPHVGQILFDAGFRMLEVPLNRPNAVDAMRILLRIAPDDAIVGGGTMLSKGDVDAVAEAGGRMMVAPNCEPDVIRYAVGKGMVALPGVATPTEAFRAIEAGAQGLKLFPAEMITPSVVKALVSVVPPGTLLMPVGGINPDNMMPYIEAGAGGFGIGSQLYKPGIDAAALKQSADTFMRVRQAILDRR
jgi:2-dehydro-3-deoxyphosphogalactonate aldolase